MRTSMRASRNRILAVGAGILLAGAALAATTGPAQALTPENQITLAPVGAQTTDPLSTPVDLSIAATETYAEATLTFAVTGLPAGLGYAQTQIAGSGEATLDITGTITTPGVYSVKVTATDDLPAMDTKAETFSWAANDDHIVTVDAPAAETSVHGTAIAPVTIGVTDSVPSPPYTYTAANLPPGLVLDAATGTVSGRPTVAASTYDATITVTDATAATGTAVIVWTIGNKITVTAKAPRKVYLRVKVSVRPSATDSARNQKLTWSVSPAHPLPPGLSISRTTGVISGRPQRLAAPPTTVIATDGTGSTGSAVIRWVVSVDGHLDNPGPQTLTAGQGQDFILRAVDYVPGDTMTWTATGLPAGMGFRPSVMMIYGWPAQAGTYHVTLTGRGSRGSYDTMTFKLVVKAATGRGPSGQVRLALDGRCLRDPGASTANGTRITLGTCGAGAGQRWTVATDGTIRAGGRCLDIAGTASAAGQPLELWGCGNASPRQTWTQGGDGELVNPASGLCVTDPGSSGNNGAAPAMGACRARAREQWTLPAQPILASVGGSCADDYHSLGTDGSVVDMFFCNGTRGQAWTFRPDGTIRAGLYGDACVTAPARTGARVELRPCSARTTGQQWTVTRAGPLTSELRAGGACLAVPSLTAKNAAPLITARCAAGDPRVRWHIG